MFIGIDPGLSGAIAWLHEDGTAKVEDMPTMRLTINKNKNRRELDLPKLISLLRDSQMCGVDIVALEKVHGMPKMGGAAMFSFGRCYGQVESILCTLYLPFVSVPPQEWKKHMLTGTAKSKGDALIVARRMFPNIVERLNRKSDDGRAEALLMAAYARMKYSASGTSRL